MPRSWLIALFVALVAVPEAAGVLLAVLVVALLGLWLVRGFLREFVED